MKTNSIKREIAGRNPGRRKPASAKSLKQKLDDLLHEALLQSFDCGDPVAITIAR
ncbi:MAG: hypothetical protein ACRCVZ_07140 [Aestuariivirga sp.]